MKYSITTRQMKAGTAFDLYVHWKGQRALYEVVLAAEEAAIAMIAKIQTQPAPSNSRQDRRTLRDLVPLFWTASPSRNGSITLAQRGFLRIISYRLLVIGRSRL